MWESLSTKSKEGVLHLALRVRRFMAIRTSCGSTFHRAAVTPGKAVSHAHGFPVLVNSFIIAGRLTAEECFMEGGAGITASRYPRWDFWVACHQLGRAGTVCRWWLWLLSRSVTSSSLKRSPCRVESSFPFSFFSNLCTGLCSGLTTDSKPPERPGSAQSYIPNLEVVCECPTEQWKAHLYLVSWLKTWKKGASSTGFLFGNGAKSKSCNCAHQRRLLFRWWVRCKIKIKTGSVFTTKITRLKILMENKQLRFSLEKKKCM